MRTVIFAGRGSVLTVPKAKYPTTTPDWQSAVRRRTWFYTIVAFLFAILFAVFYYQINLEKLEFLPGDLVPALFAVEDIDLGTALTEEMLEIKQVPSQSVPQSSFRFKEEVIGKVLYYPLTANEVLTPEKLVGSTDSLLSQRCPSGKWCVNIPEAWLVAPPPRIEIGDHLEIAAVLPGRAQDESGYIATDVEIIVVPGDLNNRSYIFAVNDQEALSLLFAHANDFQIMVVLRPFQR